MALPFCMAFRSSPLGSGWTEGLPAIRYRELSIEVIQELEQLPRLPGTIRPGKRERTQDSASCSRTRPPAGNHSLSRLLLPRGPNERSFARAGKIKMSNYPREVPLTLALSKKHRA